MAKKKTANQEAPAAEQSKPEKPAAATSQPSPAAVSEKPVEQEAPAAAEEKSPTKSERIAPTQPQEVAGEVQVYEVSIPNCLLGKQFVAATNPTEAVEKYKRPCGITAHEFPADYFLTDLDPENLPEGIQLYGEPAGEG